MKIVILGLSITSSWGNGHAATYRALVRELSARRHDVLFLEADRAWAAANRDLPEPAFARVELYSTFAELRDRFGREVSEADVVVLGSLVPDGIAIGDWLVTQARGLKIFYDIDTPVTLAKLARGDEEYISAPQISRYDLYLSLTGGPILRAIESRFGAPSAKALYGAVDPELYFPDESARQKWDLGYLGNYSVDRQSSLEKFLIEPSLRLPEGRFAVAGAQYPDGIAWGDNVTRLEHLPAGEHRSFYSSQRFTLNITRRDMIHAGYSPSVRLFEAAACGTPIISDWWRGLDTFFEPGREILIARTVGDVHLYLTKTSEEARRELGARARARVIDNHTARSRAQEFETLVSLALEDKARANRNRKAAGIRGQAWPVVS